MLAKKHHGSNFKLYLGISTLSMIMLLSQLALITFSGYTLGTMVNNDLKNVSGNLGQVLAKMVKRNKRKPAQPTPTPTPTVTITATAKPTATATPTAKPTATPAPVSVNTSIKREAWIYPGQPACASTNEYKTRGINTLMIEYMAINASGGIDMNTVDSEGCNGYSAANAASIKAYSKEQYVTISGSLSGILTMMNDATLQADFVSQVTNFIVQIGFTGVDIDFEQLERYSDSDYAAYKATLSALGDALHDKGKKLQVDLPTIESAGTQTAYKLKYEDLNSLPIDQYTIMTYDYMQDYGAGKAVQPISWLNKVIDWAKAKFTNKAKISIGIPAYGYSGTCGKYNISNLTYDQLKVMPGFSSATRDSDSQEMHWQNGNTCYFYQDTVSMDAKLAAVAAKGISNVSVWHLGGNQWF